MRRPTCVAYLQSRASISNNPIQTCRLRWCSRNVSFPSVSAPALTHSRIFVPMARNSIGLTKSSAFCYWLIIEHPTSPFFRRQHVHIGTSPSSPTVLITTIISFWRTQGIGRQHNSLHCRLQSFQSLERRKHRNFHVHESSHTSSFLPT